MQRICSYTGIYKDKLCTIDKRTQRHMFKNNYQIFKNAIVLKGREEEKNREMTIMRRVKSASNLFGRLHKVKSRLHKRIFLNENLKITQTVLSDTQYTMCLSI